MRIQVITETDDTILSDIGSFWTVGPSNKADVQSKVKCLLNYSKAGWVLTPLQPVNINGQPANANEAVTITERAEVTAGKTRLTLRALR